MANGNTLEWQQEAPYKLVENDAAFKVKYTASCMCGEVQYAADSDPVSAKYCHCTDCQHLHGETVSQFICLQLSVECMPFVSDHFCAGAPFQWAALFKKDALRFVKGVDSLMFYDSANSTEQHNLPCKVSCSKCHSPLADEGRNMWMAFPTQFKFDSNKAPQAFHGDCHIFYKSRCIDIKDGKTKWSEMKGKSEEIQEA